MAAEEDKVNAGLVGTIAIAGAIFVLAIAWVLTAVVRTEVERDAQEKGAHANLKEIKQIRAEQAAAMSSAGVVSKEKQLYAIPADRAMKKVVTEIQQDPNAASPPLPEDDEEDAGADGGDAGDAGDDASGDEAATDGSAPDDDGDGDGEDSKKTPTGKPGPAPAPGPKGGQPPAPPGGGTAPAPQP